MKTIKKNQNPSGASKNVTKQQVKNMITSAKAEVPMKYSNEAFTTGLNTAGVLVALVSPAQGLSAINRTGDQIHLEKIEINWQGYANSIDIQNTFRVIIFQMVGASVPTAATVLQNGASGAIDDTSLLQAYCDPKVLRILSDEWIPSCYTGSNSVVVRRHVFKPKISLLPFAPGSTFLEAGQIYVLAFSDSGIAPNPIFNFTARSWFKDI